MSFLPRLFIYLRKAGKDYLVQIISGFLI